MLSISGGGYHIASFDPRGVGLTNPYLCPTSDEVIPYSGLPITDPKGLNATYYENVVQGEICAQSPYLEQGQVVGTAFVARDINAIAQATGEDGMIRYWGMSYGTLLGSTIGAMFPDKIDRMVLDGNINPTDYYHGPGDEAADDVDRELAFFFQTCADAGANNCPLAGDESTGPGLQAIFYDFLDGIKNGTYAVYDRDGDPFTFKRIKSSLFNYLYSASNFPTLAEGISAFYQAATTTTGTTKRQLSGAFNVSDSVGLPQYDNILSAVTCGEWDEIPAGDLGDYSELVDIYEKRSTFGGDQLIGIVFSCAAWNVTAKERYEGKFTGIKTHTPVLFVNSDKDPVTPLVSAQNSSSGFVDSKVVQHTGAGHCSTAHPSNCVQDKVKSYWGSGKIPDVSEICQPNVPNPFLGDVTTPINITDRTNSTGTDGEEERFNKAVTNLASFWDKKSSAPFVFPARLLEKAKTRREEASKVLFGRQASASASCTPISAVPATSTGKGSSSSGSSSGSTSAATSVQVVSGGLGLSVFAVLFALW